MVKITINSSYVLISIILSIRLGTDESTSPNYPGKYIIFSMNTFLCYYSALQFIGECRCSTKLSDFENEVFDKACKSEKSTPVQQ